MVSLLLLREVTVVLVFRILVMHHRWIPPFLCLYRPQSKTKTNQKKLKKTFGTMILTIMVIMEIFVVH